MTPTGLHTAYNAWYSELYAFVYNLLRNREESEEIVNDSFIKLWRSGPDVREWRAYLWKVSKNAAIDILRERQKNYQYSSLVPIEEAGDIKESEAIEAIVLARLSEEVQHLPTSTRKVFGLYWQGKGTEEIMSMLQLSRQNVLNQKAYAIKLLRNKIKQ